MNQRLILPLVLSGLAASPALAQGSGKDVTILRMFGPQLGLRLEEVDSDAVARLKLKEEKGALVVEVLEDSAAAKAGLRKDDVILRFQGESVLTAAQLTRLVRDVPAGRKVDIDIVRSGGPMKVTATLQRQNLIEPGEIGKSMEMLKERLGELDRGTLRFRDGRGSEGRTLPRGFNFKFDENGPWANDTSAGRGRLGITYTDIEGQLAAYFKAPKESAVLVNSVVEGSAAAKAGVKAGDLIIKLGEKPVEEGSDLREAIDGAGPGKDTRLTVWRDGKSVDLSVVFEDAERSRSTSTRRRRPVS